MRRRLALFAALVGGSRSPASRCGHPRATAAELKIAPVTRLPFPERGYVVSVPEALRSTPAASRCGRTAFASRGVRVDPLASSGLRFGVVLALDASESMAGAPAAAALDAGAHVRVAHRSAPRRSASSRSTATSPCCSNRQERRRRSGRALRDAAAARLRHAHLRRTDALARAAARREALVRLDRPALGRCRRRQRAVRSTRPSPPRSSSRCASSRSASARARSTQRRSARSPSGPAGRTPRPVRRRSSRRSTRSSASSSPASTSSATAPPPGRCRRSTSDRRRGSGRAATAYVAPTPSLLAPYHRSLVSTFLLSGGSPLVLALFFGLLVCGLLLLLRGARRRPSSTASRASPAPARGVQAEQRRLGRRTRRRPQPLCDRLVGGARARPRAREDDGDRAAGRRGWRSVARFSSSLIALLFSAPLLGALRPHDAAHRPRSGATEAEGRFATNSPSSSPAACRCLPRRYAPAIASTARSAWSSTTHGTRRSELRAGRAGRPARRAAGGRDAEARPADGQPRHRAGRAARRAPAHVGRQLGRDPRHRRRDDPRAGGDPPTRPDAHRAGPDGAVDPDRLFRSSWPGFSGSSTPMSMANFFSSGIGQVALVAAAAMVAAGSLIIQRIVDIDV